MLLINKYIAAEIISKDGERKEKKRKKYFYKMALSERVTWEEKLLITH